MATVDGYTAAHMQTIEDETVVSAAVNGSGDLILTKHDGSTSNAGHVKGADGATGATGATGPAGPTAPTGAIVGYSASTAPTGWLLCDGSAVSRTTYSALFAIIGTSYGAGDGSTTFNLPNLVSKIPRGASAPGTGGGADTHTHPLSDNGAAALIFGSSSSILRGRQVSFNWIETHTIPTNGVSTAVGGAVSGGIALVGATDSASNLPAYVSVVYIIKT